MLHTALTSKTLPEMGAYTSEAAFTDSTEPKESPALYSLPTVGRSTNTTSPKASAACAVIPTVPTSPSI
jgi:hypothetical protein